MEGPATEDYGTSALVELQRLIDRTEQRLGHEQEQAAKARQVAEDASRIESQTATMLKGLCQLRDAINPPTNFNTPAMANANVTGRY